MRLTVHAKPGSSKGPLIVVDGEREFTVYLRERAVDGSANDGLVRVLADHFGVSRSAVEIVRGHSARTKIVDIG